MFSFLMSYSSYLHHIHSNFDIIIHFLGIVHHRKSKWTYSSLVLLIIYFLHLMILYLNQDRSISYFICWCLTTSFCCQPIDERQEREEVTREGAVISSAAISLTPPTDHLQLFLPHFGGGDDGCGMTPPPSSSRRHQTLCAVWQLSRWFVGMNKINRN